MNDYYMFWKEEIDYFTKYTYSKPLVISESRDLEFEFIQKSLYKCIVHFVENYTLYTSLMPLSDKVLNLLEIVSNKKYKVGTYRTDFILSDTNQIKLIEITCRFALNGYLRSGVFCEIANDLLEANDIKQNNIYNSYYNDFVNDLRSFFKDRKKIYIIGGTSKEETKFIRKFGIENNLEIFELTYDEIGTHLHQLVDVVVITQLTHSEWENLPLDWVIHINKNILLNDIRTVFLIHDKRFFSVLNNTDFLKNALPENEIQKFLPYITPTYLSDVHFEKWIEAKENKNDFILKPTNLGKGEGVYYGKLISEEDWHHLLETNSSKSIIQPYIKQRKFSGYVQQEYRKDDYFVGTLLYFNDKYYGPGLIRASSHPITNQGDDRKVAACKLEDIQFLNENNSFLF